MLPLCTNSAAFILFLPFLIIAFIFIHFFKLWVKARVSGIKVSYLSLLAMKLRRIPPDLMVTALIRLNKAGINELGFGCLEAHYLAGGDVLNVVNALIAAKHAKLPLQFNRATAWDLMGMDAFQKVKELIHSSTIDLLGFNSGNSAHIDFTTVSGDCLSANCNVQLYGPGQRLASTHNNEALATRLSEAIAGVLTTCELEAIPEDELFPDINQFDLRDGRRNPHRHIIGELLASESEPHN